MMRRKPPYRRVLASPDIKDKIKVKLRKEYAMLNPAELKRKITKLQNRLLKLNALKHREDLEKRRKLQVGTSTFLLESSYSISFIFLCKALGI